MKVTKEQQKKSSDKFIDEVRLDTDKRAKDMCDYEKMLMAFIENEFKGGTK